MNFNFVKKKRTKINYFFTASISLKSAHLDIKSANEKRRIATSKSYSNNNRYFLYHFKF